jgi:hypothetical protein
MLEAIFSRGGRELAPVLVSAVEKGCGFDSWTEQLNKDAWRESFDDAGMDMQELASRSYGLDDPLPWDYLDYGVSTGFLKRASEKAFEAKLTPDCREKGCNGCGVCKEGEDMMLACEACKSGGNLRDGEVIDL